MTDFLDYTPYPAKSKDFASSELITYSEYSLDNEIRSLL